VAYFVDVPQKAHVRLHKLEFAIKVKLFALFENAIGSLLRATNDIDSGFGSILGKCPYCVFTNAAGPSNEDGDEALKEGGGDPFVGRDDFEKCNPFRVQDLGFMPG
jgi:hypothetical protein